MVGFRGHFVIRAILEEVSEAWTSGRTSITIGSRTCLSSSLLALFLFFPGKNGEDLPASGGSKESKDMEGKKRNKTESRAIEI